MRERIRARYFPKWPGAVLFFIPEGLRLTVRELEAPCEREQLQRACDDLQISEAEPGRWTQSILMARAAAKAERQQRQNQQEASEAAILRGSVDPKERDRAKLLQEKHRVEGRMREIKATLAEAKSRASTTGCYMPPRQYRGLESELGQTKQQVEAINAQLGQIKAAEKAAGK